ncbi:MAG TPA: AraC family transcriptional regulator [Pyrinomonadaceae bacterium]|jgi:AraC family transcriptional regulator of arabinose operon
MDFRVQQAKALIENSLQQDSQFDSIAKQLNISPSRLRHLFKSETGTSPMQYHKALRLEQAKHLLEITFLNVKKIMLQVGIKDESNFVRDFKRRYGLSPKQYRAQYQNSHNNQRIAILTNK